MEIISLLGAILDLAAKPYAITWDFDCDNSNIYQVYLTEFEVLDLKHITESLLEVDDEIANTNYNAVVVVFENGRISKVRYGKEEHDVKECIDCYVRDFDLDVIYVAMCAKVLSLLNKEIGL